MTALQSDRLDALAAAANGRILAGDPSLPIHGVFSDTRAPLRGGLFVALRGERFDGNVFAHEAVEKLGAAAVLIDRPEAARGLPESAGAILVDDTRSGYLGIAAAHRRRMDHALWFGITGSVGKSTTKDLLAHILRQAAAWNVHQAPGSYNNAVGLSRTVLDAREEHQAVVLELGTNHPGEIRPLALAARPQVAVITCAAASHLEAFGSIENVAREKGEILAGLACGGIAVLNADDAYLPLWLDSGFRVPSSEFTRKAITFGLSERAHVRAKHVRIAEDGCAEFMVRCGDAMADCALRVPGVHQVHNALAAIAAALPAGVRLDQAARAAGTFAGVARRFSVTTVRGFTLIDDAYNANPASFSAALSTLRALSANRKFIVAGDMLELGTKAEEYHRELGRELAALDPEMLLTVGELSRCAGSAAREAGFPALRWADCTSPEEAAQILNSRVSAGDAVLVKGSHGAHLERCCERLASA